MKVEYTFEKEEFNTVYRMGRTLGTGSFATVKICTSRSDESIQRAVKIMDKLQMKAEDEKALELEIAILQEIEHPNIVKLHQVFSSKDQVYMVMEVMTGGEMFDRIVSKEHYEENMAKREIKQVADALQYCHNRGIVHRDLKPENLLYSDETDSAVCKIADFGLAKVVNDDTLMKTACGTPGYVAPEILLGKPYTEKVDVWSLGVITYILLCGFPPFYDQNNANLFRKIKKGQFDFPSPYWDNVSSEAKKFISSMLVVDPKKRIPVADILTNAWVNGTENSDITKNLSNLKEYNASRKFKQAITRVQAINRLKTLSTFRSELKNSEDEGGATVTIAETLVEEEDE